MKIVFNKRRQFYRDGDGYQRGLPVMIDGMRFPDAREVMNELVHWYFYDGSPRVVIQGMTSERHDQLLHLGAFFHPSGSYRNVVTAGNREHLVEIIDTISLHLDGELYNGCTVISSSGRRTFEGR